MGIELIAGEQPAHGVAPACYLMKAQRRTAKWKDPTLYFHLCEAGVARAKIDIRRQHQLDSDGQAITLRRDNHRFAHPWPDKNTPRIATAGRNLPALGKGGACIHQIQTGGKMLAMAEHHRHPRLAVSLEFAISQAQLIQQVEVEGIALGRSIQADHMQVTTALPADATRTGLIHGNFLERGGRGPRPHAAHR